MSYLQVTAVRPSLRAPDQFNALRGSATRYIAPVKIFNLHNVIKPSVGSSKRCIQLMKCNVIRKTRASCYQPCTLVCSFGAKGEAENSNEASPWKSIEKAMSSFKKLTSLEDVLRQQMQRKDYYDGDPPSGGGGGGGSGFGGTDDEGFAGILDDILQVMLAILALVVLYLYIIAGDQVRAKVPYDPYWPEKVIITTPTWWDSPEKYRLMLKSYDRAIKTSKSKLYSDSDENATSSDNAYEDSDNDNSYINKAYDDDDEDDNAYIQDVDDF